MTRHYDQPIRVRCAANGVPRQIVWREVPYRVLEVLSRWHLRDRWWADVSAGPGARPSDRHYYRLRCTENLICDVYYDAASAAWMLENLYD